MQSHQTGKRRILVAEDDSLFATTVQDYLTEEGFTVVLSGDGQQALETAAKTCFAALLTDLRMPRLDGVALVRRLREKWPKLPIVVITGYPPEDGGTSLQQANEGPMVLLEKPVGLTRLRQALNHVLGGGKTQSATC
jgi:CheY-like chemotaxis protein